jgi:DNA-binding MarR family transcriptional regulator
MSHVEREPDRWTFFTNHAHVLFVLAQTPDMRIRDVAARVGITERAAQRMITDLEHAGYLSVERVGRRNRYHLMAQRPLRHPIEAHRTAEDLLRVLLPDPR